MKNLWSEILVPAVIAGLTVIGTVGVESARTVRPETRVRLLREVRLDTLRRDTVPQDTGKKAAPVKKDTVLKNLSDENFDFFGVSVQDADTTPKVSARDTMKVPDSLRTRNPFLYRWYVAIKDSLTHRTVVDSLKAAGDSLDWPRIDSLYFVDSTAAAKERFRRWYEGLSRKERKKYDTEQKIQRTIRRQDSIQHIKDSVKHIKDSIVQNTPRILETAWLPDSLYYKRLVAWKHDRHFNRVDPYVWDTTANYHFHDYPYLKEDIGGTFLGMAGSAVQTYNFFKREDPRSTVSYYAPYESWTYTASSIPMFNTKTPYTELAYYGNILNSETTSNESSRTRRRATRPPSPRPTGWASGTSPTAASSGTASTGWRTAACRTTGRSGTRCSRTSARWTSSCPTPRTNTPSGRSSSTSPSGSPSPSSRISSTGMTRVTSGRTR